MTCLLWNFKGSEYVLIVHSSPLHPNSKGKWNTPIIFHTFSVNVKHHWTFEQVTMELSVDGINILVLLTHILKYRKINIISAAFCNIFTKNWHRLLMKTQIHKLNCSTTLSNCTQQNIYNSVHTTFLKCPSPLWINASVIMILFPKSHVRLAKVILLMVLSVLSLSYHVLLVLFWYSNCLRKPL